MRNQIINDLATSDEREFLDQLLHAFDENGGKGVKQFIQQYIDDLRGT
jgi:hypothetical protein